MYDKDFLEWWGPRAGHLKYHIPAHLAEEVWLAAKMRYTNKYGCFLLDPPYPTCVCDSTVHTTCRVALTMLAADKNWTKVECPYWKET